MGTLARNELSEKLQMNSLQALLLFIFKRCITFSNNTGEHEPICCQCTLSLPAKTLENR